MSFSFRCPHCNQKIEAEENWIGQEANCPACGEKIVIAKTLENKQIEIQQESKMKEYKILTQKDKWLTSKFDPEALEKALNAYAEQGWRVVSSVTASFPGFLSANREEMIIILERDK